MRRRPVPIVLLSALSATCVAALAALPVGAAQITSISWEVTGGSALRLLLPDEPVTGGSLIWTPTAPVATPCTDCGGDAMAILSLTGASFSFHRAFQSPRVTISSAYVRMFASGFVTTFGVTFPNPTGTSPSSGRGGFYSGYHGPFASYGFTLGSEVRTAVPEPDGPTLFGVGLLVLACVGGGRTAARALGPR